MNWPKVSEKFSEELLEKLIGKLPAYTDIGQYPLYYVLTDPYETGNENQSLVLCVNCANQEEVHAKLQMYYDINWESHMVCDVCGNLIEAAYNL